MNKLTALQAKNIVKGYTAEDIFEAIEFMSLEKRTSVDLNYNMLSPALVLEFMDLGYKFSGNKLDATATISW